MRKSLQPISSIVPRASVVRAIRLGFSTWAADYLREVIRSSPRKADQAHAAALMSRWFLTNNNAADAYTYALEIRHLAGWHTDLQAYLEVESLTRLNLFEQARAVLEDASRFRERDVNWHLMMANTFSAATESQERLARLNQVYLGHGMTPIQLIDAGHPLILENVEGNYLPSDEVSDGESVSILIPCFNAAKTVSTAIKSALRQSWRPLEIIAVNDASSDDTLKTLRKLSELDDRIRVIDMPKNLGTYAARNIALANSKSRFVLALDADDWLHPEAVARLMRVLESNPSAALARGKRMRVKENLQTVPPLSPLLDPRRRLTSLVNPSLIDLSKIRNQRWLSKSRVGGDVEFLSRLQALIGVDCVVDDLDAVPLELTRSSEGTLTTHPSTGMLSITHIGGARGQFKKSYLNVHSRIDPEMHNDEVATLVSEIYVPPVIRSERCAISKIADCTYLTPMALQGGTTSAVLEELRALTGVTRCLASNSVPTWSSSESINPKYWELIKSGVELLSLGESVSSELVVVRSPLAVEILPDSFIEFNARKVICVINQLPHDDPKEKNHYVFSLPRVAENLNRLFPNSDIMFSALSPSVQTALKEHYATEMAPLRFTDFHWGEIVDLAQFERDERIQRRMDTWVVGRHGRDSELKWPDTKWGLLSAYPETDEFDVHILGGVDSVKAKIEAIPRNWTVWEFDDIPVPDFLKGLDVYVYFANPRCVEAFGRVLIEAMAAGVPVITSPNFEEILGRGAIYTQVNQVKDWVIELRDNRSFYEQQVKLGLSVVGERYSPDAFKKRTIELIQSNS